jgi:hypothetical protein
MVLAFAVAATAVRTASASTLDPFRRASTPRAASLDPFRVADAAPAAAAPARKPAPAPSAAPPPKACQKDEDCTDDTICEANTCQVIRTRTNIAYLYYREGAFRQILLLYWGKRGSDGFTVLVPFYWHFWNPSSETRIVAPFFWRFEDRARQDTTTVIWPILPVSWSRGPNSRSLGVWPLFYTSNTLGWAVPLLGTFSIRDPATQKRTGALLYLYWWRRGPERSVDLAFPLFVSSRTAAHAFTYAVPLNFYWRNADNANTLVLPLFYLNTNKNGSWFLTWLGYHHREGPEYGSSFAWIFYWGGNDKEHSKYQVLFPLYWNFYDRKEGTTILAPLVWSFRSPKANTTVVGPIVHLRREQWTFNTLFPVWWNANDPAAGTATHLVLPLFLWHASDHGKSSLFVTLLGGSGRDDRAGTAGWLFWPLLSFHRHDPEHRLTVLTPLYVSHESSPEHSRTRLYSLLFYLRDDPEGSTRALFPLFWHFREADTGATASLLLPLFFRRSGPRDTTTLVGPFYWRSFTNGGWSGGLFPIAYFGDNAGRGHGVVFPLFWRFSTETTSTTVMLPLYYRQHDPHGAATGIVPLLLFTGHHDGDSYAVQFPLFFHFASERDGSSTTVTPVGYLHHDRDGSSGGLGPLVPLIYYRSGRERSHFVLFPLFWHFTDRRADETTTVIGPYWHRTRGGETTDGLFPFVHYRRGARPGGSDETSLTVFPLFHYRRDAQTHAFVTLLGGSMGGPHREGGFVGPFIWYRDADLTARWLPFLYADVTRKATGERTRQIGPWFAIDGPGRSSRVLFPLFGRYTDEHERDTWVLPTFFRLRRDNGDRVDTFLPLFWHSSFGGRTTTVVGPYYDRTTPEVHNNGLVPLFFHARNAERTLTVMPLLLFTYRHETAGDHSWLWFTLFYRSSDPQRSRTMLFPILYAKRDGPRRSDVLFPIFWHFADDEARTNWWLAALLFSSTKGTRSTRGLAPLAWYTRDAATGETANALLPLFYQSSGKDRASFYTLLGGYRREGPSRFWYVTPFVFRHRDEATETTTTVIPPLLYVSHGNPESRLTTFLGLFWHQRDIGSSTTLGLPLYYDVNEFHLSRTSVLLPFGVRYERASDQNTYWVAPLLLFYRHTSPTDGTTIAFPLYWDFRHGDERTMLLFPLYAHWRRPGYAGTYVFPLYYYREGLHDDGTPDGTYRRFIFPLYDSGIKRPGDFQWELLGGLVGQERIGHHHFLRLFYMTFETGSSTRAQTAWYGQQAPSRRRATPRGLSVAGF